MLRLLLRTHLTYFSLSLCSPLTHLKLQGFSLKPSSHHDRACEIFTLTAAHRRSSGLAAPRARSLLFTLLFLTFSFKPTHHVVCFPKSTGFISHVHLITSPQKPRGEEPLNILTSVLCRFQHRFLAQRKRTRQRTGRGGTIQ